MDIKVVETVSELEECLAIRKRVFVEEQRVPVELEIDEYDSSPEAAVHILAKSGGKPAGTGRLISYDPQTAKLQRLAVIPEYRGQNVGKLLVQTLERQARLAGYAYCILDGQCQAEAFYHKLGYETISDEPFDDAGILHVRMKKALRE